MDKQKKGHRGYWNGKKRPDISEGQRGEKNYMWGKHHSIGTKEKMSEAQKKVGNQPPHGSGENHSNWKGGKAHCLVCNKLLTNYKAKYCKKHLPFTKEHRENISKAQKKRIIEGKHNWYYGGLSFEPYTTDWTETLRRSIRERDHYTCQLCGKSQGDITHDVHHIDYNKKNCNSDNLITLCHSCHPKTNSNRNHWTNYFNNRINL